MFGEQVGLGVAFLAGLISFLSPCVLPLVPTYVTYLAGTSAKEIESGVSKAARRKILLNAFTFVFGFSVVFIAFGLTASAVGQLLSVYSGLIRRVSGILIVFMGLHMTGLFNLILLERERRVTLAPSEPGLMKSFALGTTFSAGWTPCIGPILAGILAVAATGETAAYGGWLLATYALGLGLPFLATALFLGAATRFLRRLGPHLGRIRVLGGVLLIVMGFLVYTNVFFTLNAYVHWGF